LAFFKNEEGKIFPPAARLYRMIMSESTFFIWKLRCDRVIKYNGDPYTKAEVQNRWIALLNEKLEIDRALTNRVKFGKQYSVDPLLVLDTWRGSLLEEHKLSRNWLREPEVLVGIVSMRSDRPPSPPDFRETWPD
ncbi:hypothetical protein C8R43DRAFT_878575, partial [Mycena crocata]